MSEKNELEQLKAELKIEREKNIMLRENNLIKEVNRLQEDAEKNGTQLRFFSKPKGKK